ncbi:MAG: hypothetical protein IPO63_18490 [Bacteroidetes bacterium]|nr:hypothetical protein [Bacteroidota bacterium]
MWGDTVNIAARLGASWRTGKNQHLRNTYQLVKDKIRCSSRGK